MENRIVSFFPQLFENNPFIDICTDCGFSFNYISLTLVTINDEKLVRSSFNFYDIDGTAGSAEICHKVSDMKLHCFTHPAISYGLFGHERTESWYVNDVEIDHSEMNHFDNISSIITFNVQFNNLYFTDYLHRAGLPRWTSELYSVNVRTENGNLVVHIDWPSSETEKIINTYNIKFVLGYSEKVNNTNNVENTINSHPFDIICNICPFNCRSRIYNLLSQGQYEQMMFEYIINKILE